MRPFPAVRVDPLFGIAAALFAASLVATVALSRDMADMGAVPMPGGWDVSAMWLSMCGGSRMAAAGCFVAMWSMMTLAMMLPVLTATLARYRRDGATNGATAEIAAAYLLIWITPGVVLAPVTLGLADWTLDHPGFARTVPVIAGAVLILAGVTQFGGWKARRLTLCAAPPAVVAPWRQGAQLGRHCVACCAAPTAALLAAGMMDPLAMIAVTGAITLERLAPAPWGLRFARLSGGAAITVGALSIVSAV